jgi:hypothetical protein
MVILIIEYRKIMVRCCEEYVKALMKNERLTIFFLTVILVII